MRKLKILCESKTCVHRDSRGHYGMCNHPTCRQIVAYNGISRIYAKDCDMYQRYQQIKASRRQNYTKGS